MSNSDKKLIVHITSGDAEQLRDLLHLDGAFKNSYDGWEKTCDSTTGRAKSTRYYYYAIPHENMLGMLKTLRRVTNGKGYKYKIKIIPAHCSAGNYNFD